MPAISDGVRRSRRVFGYTLVAAGTLGLATCIMVLYLATRTVMIESGGFVALGGPYAIAHPAPGWIWLVPGSILMGVAFIGLHAAGVRRLGGFPILMPMWVTVFLALGWNFLDLGLRASGPDGIAWIVCGVTFWLMASFPLFTPLFKNNPSVQNSWMAFPGPGTTIRGSALTIYSAVQLLAAVGGALVGVLLFSALT